MSDNQSVETQVDKQSIETQAGRFTCVDSADLPAAHPAVDEALIVMPDPPTDAVTNPENGSLTQPETSNGENAGTTKKCSTGEGGCRLKIQVVDDIDMEEDVYLSLEDKQPTSGDNSEDNVPLNTEPILKLENAEEEKSSKDKESSATEANPTEDKSGGAVTEEKPELCKEEKNTREEAATASNQEADCNLTEQEKRMYAQAKDVVNLLLQMHMDEPQREDAGEIETNGHVAEKPEEEMSIEAEILPAKVDATGAVVTNGNAAEKPKDELSGEAEILPAKVDATGAVVTNGNGTKEKPTEVPCEESQNLKVESESKLKLAEELCEPIINTAS